MSIFSPATNQTSVDLPEPGRYTFRCVSIEEAPDKGYGPGVLWKFTLTDPAGVTLATPSGDEYELWQFTSQKLSPGARARQYADALLGRPLAEGETPNPRDLVGREMVGVLIHEPNKADPLRVTGRVTSVKATTGAPSATAAAPANGAADVGALIEKLKGAVHKAEVLATPHHLDWLQVEPEKLGAADLERTLAAVNADIAAA